MTEHHGGDARSIDAETPAPCRFPGKCIGTTHHTAFNDRLLGSTETMLPQTAMREAPFEITAMTTPAGIRLRGDVDIATLPILELALELVVNRAADATVDLSELTFIDLGGLRALARAAIRLRMTGRCLRLRGTGTWTRRILSLLGWAELFELIS
jgi:anti-anti-sigma factor